MAHAVTASALFLALILHADASAGLVTSLTYPAGFEPHKAKGERGLGQARECSRGYYKQSEGAHQCKLCPPGSIAALEGATSCTRCHASDETSDASRTVCVPKGGSSDDLRVLQSPGRDWKTLASTPLQKGPCTPQASGSQLCPIPVGYWDNSRSGSVLFPEGYSNTAIPYMLLLHGSGWTGSDMINVFKAYAIKYKFAIIAPDSHNALYWSSPDTADAPYTADFYHIQACWDAVMKFPGVVVNSKFVTSFGNSFASYSAVSFASRSTVDFNSAAVLHAAALPQQMGPRVFPILWVTGTKDPLYGPGPAAVDVAKFRKAKPQYPISWQQWVDGHTIRNYTQIEYMIKWWLDPSIRSNPIQT